MKKRIEYILSPYVGIAIVAIVSIIVLICNITIADRKISMQQQKIDSLMSICNSTKVDTFSVKALTDELNRLNVKHVDVVIAQFYLETGYYSSKSSLFSKANNLFGFKNPIVRPTASIGYYKIGNQKYAKYKHWKDCVIDYALYQARFLKHNMNKSDWIKFINRNYSTSKNYNIQKLL